MFSNKSIIILLLVFHTTISQRSFTVVLDTTNSMREDLYIIKANIENVVNSLNKDEYTNFILVSFGHSVVDPPYITDSPRSLTTQINTLTTSDPSDECPENSLAGIEAALIASEKQSTINNIFVFTDAYANDFAKFPAVERLCKEKHSQVTIFLSGYCSTAEIREQGLEVYFNLAKACSGAVLRFDPVFTLRQAFKYMKEVANVEWTNVTYYDEFENFKSFAFSIDTFTTDFMIVATGENPSIELKLTSDLRSAKMDIMLENRHTMAVSVSHSAEIGEYTANIRSRGNSRVRFYERIFVPFEFGFSTLPPRNIAETSTRPIPGWTNYMLIKINKSVKLRLVEWLVYGESVKQMLLLRQISAESYITSVHVNSDEMFTFWILGSDTDTQRELKASSKLLSPQKTANFVTKLAPEAKILDKDLGLIDYGAELILACNCAAHPKPTIEWKDDNDNDLTSKDGILELPYMYISYVTISKVSKNSTITCSCENSEGSTSNSIDIFVNRTLSFEVIQKPEDVTVEYGNQQYLYCEVDAYPDATISWYINETLVDSFNTRVLIEDNALLINEMGLEDVGSYECRATNAVETKKFAASVEISGIESPKLEDVIKTEIVLELGAKAELECRIETGKPTPEVVWKYKKLDDFDFNELPSGVTTVNDDKLHIESVDRSHVGVYRCTASNVLGEDHLDLTVTIKYAPVIKNKEWDFLQARLYDEVVLLCEVDAVPEATVRWELRRGPTVMPFNPGHITYENNTHSFRAMSGDSGEYHCIADNEVGKTERIVEVSVQVPPRIKAPSPTSIVARVGDEINLDCTILYGSPTPTITWLFKAKNSIYTQLPGNGDPVLRLKNLTQYNEGTYLCNAENTQGYDNIRYELKIEKW